MTHIFISYAHVDRSFVSKHLTTNLKNAGFTTWMDSDKLRAGKDWRQEIDNGIRSSFALVLVMSPAAKKSEYVTYEWSYALGAGIQVIPLLLEKVKLHSRLEALHYLDFTDHFDLPWDDLFSLLTEEDNNNHVAVAKQNSDEFATEPSRTAITTHYQRAVPSLIADLIDPNVSVRIKAIKALVRIGDEQSLQGIIDALKDSDKSVRIAAADALGNFHSVYAVSALIKTLQDKTGYVRAHAAKSLGIIGDNRAVSALSKLLDDETATVQKSAYEALEKMSTSKAHDAIEEWRQKNQNQNKSSHPMQALRESIQSYTISLGSDVRFKQLKNYIVYERTKNFISIVTYMKRIDVFLNLNPEDVILEEGFTRDMRNKGHWGTGDLLVTIENTSDLEKAKPLIIKSYEEN